MPGICCYELAVMRSAEIFSCSKSSLRTSYQLQTPSNTAPREWQDAFSMRKFRSFCKWHILHVPPYFFSTFKNMALWTKHPHALESMWTSHVSDHCLLQAPLLSPASCRSCGRVCSKPTSLLFLSKVPPGESDLKPPCLVLTFLRILGLWYLFWG